MRRMRRHHSSGRQRAVIDPAAYAALRPQPPIEYCIDDLLGPRAHALGINCPCVRHTHPEPPATPASLPRMQVAGAPDAKMAAANDRED
jgi:hypothetical protein